MHDSYPRRHEPPLDPSQFAAKLNDDLMQQPLEAVAESDPRELADMLQQLPKTTEDWQAQQINIKYDIEGVSARRSGIIHILDHVTRQPIEGFALRFFQAVDELEQAGSDPVFDATFLPTVLRRSINNKASTPEARLAVARWIVDKLDDDALSRAVRGLDLQKRDQLLESGEYPERIHQAAEKAREAEADMAERRRLEISRAKSRLRRSSRWVEREHDAGTP